MKIAKIFNSVAEVAKAKAHSMADAATTNKNIRTVRRMIGDSFYTEKQKLGNGAFQVLGYRPLSDYYSSSRLSESSVASVYSLATSREFTPSMIVRYDPKEGLETLIREKTGDMFYRVTQKPGGEPEIDESFLVTLTKDVREKAVKTIAEIKESIGTIIPTLKNIKQ
ncbi:MAG: hypothetical protein E7Z91_04030 [Cyanobacteria bacterium SIG30]|nr:hypothetical protein [Cyanobacteria bacterium SIG30]